MNLELDTQDELATTTSTQPPLLDMEGTNVSNTKTVPDVPNTPDEPNTLPSTSADSKPLSKLVDEQPTEPTPDTPDAMPTAMPNPPVNTLLTSPTSEEKSDEQSKGKASQGDMAQLIPAASYTKKYKAILENQPQVSLKRLDVSQLPTKVKRHKPK